MTLTELMSYHREMNDVVRGLTDSALRSWYEKLGLTITEEKVSLNCPGCGAPVSKSIHEFIHYDSDEELVCNSCRGELEERGGAMG